MAEDWEQYAVNADTDWEQYAVTDKSASSGAVDATLGTAAVAGAGAAAYGVKKFAEPFVQRGPVRAEFEQFRQQLGMPKGVSPELITQTIASKAPQIRSETTQTAAQIRSQGMASVNQLKQSLKDFDNTVLNTSVERLAGTVKEGYPQFLSKGYGAYEAGLNAAEDIMSKQNVSFSGTDFKSVIDKTLQYAEKKGYLDNQIKPLKKLSSDLGRGAAGLVNEKGQPLTASKISLIKAKGNLTNIASTGKLPSDVVRILRENWGTMLEKVAPDEAKAMLKSINQNYKPFAEVRNKMAGIIDPRTGQADTSKLYNYLKSYATKQQDTGVRRVMEILQKDIPDAQKQFSELTKLKGSRTALARAPQETQIKMQQRLDALYKEASVKIQEAQQWTAKARQSQDLLNQLDKRVAKRVGAVKGAAKVGAGIAGLKYFGHLFNALPFVSEGVRALNNSEELQGMSPEQIFLEWRKQNDPTFQAGAI